MGFLNVFSKKSTKPYKNEAVNKIYELLFCDNIDLYRLESKSHDHPWDILLNGTADIDKLKIISNDKTLESRQRILACNLLLVAGSTSNDKELLGVIVEVALPGGLDVLAVYNDGTARYINQSESLLVWETKTEVSNNLIGKLFFESEKTIAQIGPWNEARKPFPRNGMVRLTFLVSDGLYFGEGLFEILQADHLGGPIINSATAIMAYLIQRLT